MRWTCRCLTINVPQLTTRGARRLDHVGDVTVGRDYIHFCCTMGPCFGVGGVVGPSG